MKRAYVVMGSDGPVAARRPTDDVLASLSDPDVSLAERTQMARILAVSGFTIDVPVDVWGWDWEKTMRARLNYGYRWVPAAGMEPVRVAPGLPFPGLGPYEPDAPPRGAILVRESLEAAGIWL